MNIEMILSVAQRIEADGLANAGKHFRMDDWVTFRSDEDEADEATYNEERNICNSAACIAGTVVLMNMEKAAANRIVKAYFNIGFRYDEMIKLPDFRAQGAKLLGLRVPDTLGDDDALANQLFAPWDSTFGGANYGPQAENIEWYHAVWTLRNLAQTGEVRWDVTMTQAQALGPVPA